MKNDNSKIVDFSSFSGSNRPFDSRIDSSRNEKNNVSNIINFPSQVNSKGISNQSIDSESYDEYENDYDGNVNLDEWISTHHKEDELRTVFLNMDKALKYIHEHGYCIEFFSPYDIEILFGRPDYIKFKHLVELSKNSVQRQKMIKEDIFNSSFIQIGYYTNTIKYLLNPSSDMRTYLKEHFEEFGESVPKDDFPYYRGIVKNGASVYYTDYRVEKANRDLAELEKQLNEEGISDSNSKPLVKSNGKNLFGDSSNDHINDTIYRQINGLREAAFINGLIIPAVILVSLLLIAFICWFLSAY